MVSRIEGERFIIAATLDSVETGQEFERIPPHMTVVRWFQLQDHRQARLIYALNSVFSDKVLYQDLVAGRKRKYGERKQFNVREISGAEEAPSFALRAFVKSMGRFRQDDIYADTFSAHVTDDPTRKIRWHEKLAIPTVALITAHTDEPMQHVVESFKLGTKEIL